MNNVQFRNVILDARSKNIISEHMGLNKIRWLDDLLHVASARAPFFFPLSRAEWTVKRAIDEVVVWIEKIYGKLR